MWDLESSLCEFLLGAYFFSGVHGQHLSLSQDLATGFPKLANFLSNFRPSKFSMGTTIYLDYNHKYALTY